MTSPLFEKAGAENLKRAGGRVGTEAVPTSQKQKALAYYYANVEKYREYYQRNKLKIIEYQKAHNKAIRSGYRAPQSRKQCCFKIEHKTVIWSIY